MIRHGVKAVAIATVVALVLLLVGRSAFAHAIGVSKGDYAVAGKVVSIQTTFARGEITPLVPSLDPDKTGTIEASAVTRAYPEIERLVMAKIVVRADGQKCVSKLDEATLTEQDGIAIRGHADCPVPVTKLGLELELLGELSHGHRHIAHVVAGSVAVDEVCYRGHAAIEAAVIAQEVQAPTPPAHVPIFEFVRMGLEHILTGYDHLVFLFGLVLIGGRVRSLVGVITAFTIAHSITLALATLDVWSPSPRFVEPMIAMSIAYVGLENFFLKNAEKRWRITFPFGLIHGFGFAGALQEIGLPREQIPTALVTFNAGVEIGQLGVLAVILPVIFWLRKLDWFQRYGVKVLSGLIVVAGLAWFAERIWHPA